MLLLLAVAVVSAPAVADGVAYLADAGKPVTFDPVSYQTTRTQGICQTGTDGILETGSTGVQATWPAKGSARQAIPGSRAGVAVRAWCVADRQRRDRRHRRSPRPGDRGARRLGSGLPRQAGAQLAPAPAASPGIRPGALTLAPR